MEGLGSVCVRRLERAVSVERGVANGKGGHEKNTAEAVAERCEGGVI